VVFPGAGFETRFLPATVAIDDKIENFHKGQFMYIPLSAKHITENLTERMMMLIEGKIRSPLGEDDIISHEDRYQRN
jgi:mannose-6-phosphate isomerase-like protein (cupin superfamily)